MFKMQKSLWGSWLLFITFSRNHVNQASIKQNLNMKEPDLLREMDSMPKELQDLANILLGGKRKICPVAYSESAGSKTINWKI